MWIVPGGDAVVRVDDHSRDWAVSLWQFGEWHEAPPVMFAGPAWHRAESRAAGPDRKPPEGSEPVCAVAVGIDDVLHRRVEVAQRGAEIRYRHRSVDRMDRLGGAVILAQGRERERDRRARRGCAGRVGRDVRDDRPVAGRAHGQRFWCATKPDFNLLAARGERRTTAWRQVTSGIFGVDPLDEQVLGVGVGRRQAPGEVAVLPDHEERLAGQRAA